MQSRLTPLRFARSIFSTRSGRLNLCASALPIHRGYITDLHRKSVTFAKEHCALSAAANASQISVVYTIDCISYVFLFYNLSIHNYQHFFAISL